MRNLGAIWEEEWIDLRGCESVVGETDFSSGQVGQNY